MNNYVIVRTDTLERIPGPFWSGPGKGNVWRCLTMQISRHREFISRECLRNMNYYANSHNCLLYHALRGTKCIVSIFHSRLPDSQM